MKKYIKLFYVFIGHKIIIKTDYSIYFTVNKFNNKRKYDRETLYLCYCGKEPYFECKFGLHDISVYEDQNINKILFKLGFDRELQRENLTIK